MTDHDRKSAAHTEWASRQTRTYTASVLAPLDADEADNAIRLALDLVMNSGAARSDRLRTFPPRLRIEKPSRRDEAPKRLVWVRVRESDRRVVHEISVADGSVVEHQVNEHGDPPFTEEELAIGRRLLADPGTEVEWFNPGHGGSRLLGARLVSVEQNRVVDVVDTVVVDLDNEFVSEEGDLNG